MGCFMSSKLKKVSILLTMVLTVSIIGLGRISAYSNYEGNETVNCGNNFLTDIPSVLPKILNIVYVALQIAVPVILVIMGSIDLFKAITAGKDDEIKKSQQTFVKRLIVAMIVFFVFAIVRLVISFVGDGNSIKIINCADCLINNDCGKKSDSSKSKKSTTTKKSNSSSKTTKSSKK